MHIRPCSFFLLLVFGWTVTCLGADSPAWQEDDYRIRLTPLGERETPREPGTTRIGERTILAGERMTLQAEINRQVADEGDWDRVRYAPQAFLLFGNTLYAGLGIGTYYQDRTVGMSPFWSVRTGMAVQLQDRLHLDLHAQFRVRDSMEERTVHEDDPTTDSVHVGGALRIDF